MPQHLPSVRGYPHRSLRQELKEASCENLIVWRVVEDDYGFAVRAKHRERAQNVWEDRVGEAGERSRDKGIFGWRIV